VRWCVDRVFWRESSFVYWRERFRCHNHKWKNSILSEFFWCLLAHVREHQQHTATTSADAYYVIWWIQSIKLFYNTTQQKSVVKWMCFCCC
jgi:hypothetical protein